MQVCPAFFLTNIRTSWHVHVMFVRTKRSDRNGVAYEYLQIVRSYREGGKVRQQVVASLGRKEALLASGELDGLLRSLGNFSDKLRVVEAVRTIGDLGTRDSAFVILLSGYLTTAAATQVGLGYTVLAYWFVGFIGLPVVTREVIVYVKTSNTQTPV
jgi:hypothetical protein